MKKRDLARDRLRQENRLKAMLTAGELERLSRDNPFRRERDDLIRKLAKARVKLVLISQVSGIPMSTVQRIASLKENRLPGRGRKRKKGAGNGLEMDRGHGGGNVGGADPGVCGGVEMGCDANLSGNLRRG